MLLPYRLHRHSCWNGRGFLILLSVLLISAINVDGARKTRPDSSNSIADDSGSEETSPDVSNDQLLPATTAVSTDEQADSQQRNRSSLSVDADQQEGSGNLESIWSNGQPNFVESDDDDTTTNSTETVQVDWSTIWPYFNTGCLEWLPINHVYFQLANSFLFLSYLAPAGLYGLLYLRLMLAIGSAFFAIWGWMILCAFDTFLWNALFFLINVVHGILLLFSLRPVRFDKQVEEVRINLFWVDLTCRPHSSLVVRLSA